ncbi:MAG: flavodoxin-dependent (E)-4-hydroxy-3-methylbut-2-enyl-diphosphate synthase [Bacillota bacterium]|nr:flavodoxin-dependent (E)-4-hydroxy-3-methylbut-2-enyl-diphosphate synthase [Bacillota bacterium]
MSREYLSPRRAAREVRVGSVLIGGPAPIVIQSMNATDTRDVARTLAEIERLHAAGCQLTRVAIPDMAAAGALNEIVRRSPLPVVADIHFDHRLAIAAVENGAAKIRINPGNIGGETKLAAVVDCCRAHGVPIRVGVNAGSLSRDMLQKHGGISVPAMVESALLAVRAVEAAGLDNIVISAKASDPALTIAVNRALARETDYPLHLGVTEAGTPERGRVRAAVALGTLLAEGIGDTIRISLTGDPVLEVEAAWTILQALGLVRRGATLVSCPTCGRTEVDLVPLAAELERRISGIRRPLTVAVMGCPVNGPGEARAADVGIAGGRGEFLLFAKGEVLARVPEAEAVERLLQLIAERFPEEETDAQSG